MLLGYVPGQACPVRAARPRAASPRLCMPRRRRGSAGGRWGSPGAAGTPARRGPASSPPAARSSRLQATHGHFTEGREAEAGGVDAAGSTRWVGEASQPASRSSQLCVIGALASACSVPPACCVPLALPGLPWPGSPHPAAAWPMRPAPCSAVSVAQVQWRAATPPPPVADEARCSGTPSYNHSWYSPSSSSTHSGACGRTA